MVIWSGYFLAAQIGDFNSAAIGDFRPAYIGDFRPTLTFIYFYILLRTIQQVSRQVFNGSRWIFKVKYVRRPVFRGLRVGLGLRYFVKIVNITGAQYYITLINQFLELVCIG